MKDMTLTSVETDGMLNIAFDRGNYSVTVQEEGMEEPVTVTGKYIAILRLQPDGAWKISRLIWNENTPPPGMSEM